MWQKAVDRQYAFFGTLLGFLAGTLSVLGPIIISTTPSFSVLGKALFSVASFAVFISVLLLQAVCWIERNIAFRADNPPDVDHHLQSMENHARLWINILLPLCLFLILLLINVSLWATADHTKISESEKRATDIQIEQGKTHQKVVTDKAVDNDQTTIVCNYGNKKTFVASKGNILFTSSDFSADSLPEDKKVALRKVCEITDEEIEQGLDDFFNNPDSDPTPLFVVKPVFKE